MKRIVSLVSVWLIMSATAAAIFASAQSESILLPGPAVALQSAPAGVPAAGQAAAPAKRPQWKSRDEYDAFQAIIKAGSPQEKISAANAFLQKYPTSDFKAQADMLKVQSYSQLKEIDQAIAAAQQALKDGPAGPIRISALHYLAYVFPYEYKASAPNAAAEAAQAESQAKEGLQLLQQVRKPANASAAAFENQVKQYRVDFNRTAGFAALQQKDYANAITYLKATLADDPTDTHALSLLGQAYLYTNPPDYNTGIWYLARATAVAQQQNTPNAAALKKFYDQIYVSRHGSDAGADQILTQAAASPNPPAGFAVAPPPKHAKTGNSSVDAFYQIEDEVAVGGDQAQQAWSSLKGQPLGIVAFVESVAPGTTPGTYTVRADVLPQERGVAGDYNIELQSNQADAQYLRLGDPIRFQGTLASYTVAPKFVLTISDAQIDNASLQMASERAKAEAQKAKESKRKH